MTKVVIWEIQAAFDCKLFHYEEHENHEGKKEMHFVVINALIELFAYPYCQIYFEPGGESCIGNAKAHYPILQCL